MFVTSLANLASRLLMVAALAMPMAAGATGIVQEGSLELSVGQFDSGAFGLSSSEVPRAFQARLRVAYVGGGSPDPMDLPAELEDFALTIGNAQWDEMMDHSALMVRVAGGVIQGIDLTITVTTPHPDLRFSLPTSPGSWEAVDADNKKISGAYLVRAQVVPEPASIALLGLGFTALGWSRRRTH